MKSLFYLFLLAIFVSSCTDVLDKDNFIDEVAGIQIEEETDGYLVNISEALRVVSKINIIPSSRSMPLQIIKNKYSENAMYVYNFPEGGFIVISGIKDTYPVLAYNNTGSFDINSPIPGLDDWKNHFIAISENPGSIHPDSAAAGRTVWRQFEKTNSVATCISRDMKPGVLDPEISQRLMKIYSDTISSWESKGYHYYNLDRLKREHPELYDQYNDIARSLIWPEYEIAYEQYAYIVERGESLEDEWAPMIETSWDQKGSYVMAFGSEGTDLLHAYAGCGPVAIGQIMYYYKKPTSYDWSDMPLDHGSMTLSLFLYDIAKAANATFKNNGTSINDDGYKSAFTKFNYHYKLSKYDSDKALSDLGKGRPVILRGKDKISQDRHAYILCEHNVSYYKNYIEIWTFQDRYRFCPVNIDILNAFVATSFYINWGWNGNCNGYYRDLSTISTSNGIYDVKEMVYEIYPNN